MAGWVLEQAWLDSRQVQDLPLSDREIFSRSDLPATPDEIYTLLTQRMSRVGRNDADTTKGGNPTKRIRMRFSGQADHAMDALGLVPANIDTLSRERLPADELKRVTADALWRAVEKLRNGFTGHQFGPSTDYDVLLEDNVRLPPKAVFGLAASEVLGYEVLPRRFSAGHSSPCFRIIKAARYTIVPKGNGEMATSITQLSATDREWTEGRPRLVSHLRRERRSGLAAAKKAAFIREHGKLFCERCRLDPEISYGGGHGAACIEVHHATVRISEMAEDGHATMLEDLQCLCANCHRVVHWLLKEADNGREKGDS
jgi:hypothetical protein